MLGFINTALGYLLTGGAEDIVQVTTTPGSFATFFSLVSIDVVNPANGRVADDNHLRSGSLVTIRTRDGIYLTGEDAPTGSGRVLMSGYRGNDTARMGKDVFRIIKVGGAHNDDIGHGDAVQFGLAYPVPVPGVPEHEWISVGNPVTRPFFLAQTTDPQASEVFRIFEERAHLTGFTLPQTGVWGQETGFLQGRVSLSGPPDSTLPGGFAVRIESSTPPADAARVAPVPADASESPLEIRTAGHEGRVGGCDPAIPIRVSVQSVVQPQEEFTAVVTLRPQPSAHLTLRLDRVVRPGGCLPGITGILPWPAVPVYYLQLVRVAAEGETPSPAADVVLSSEDPRILHLTPFGQSASVDAPLGFSFTLGRLPAGSHVSTCATISASYVVDNHSFSARFGIRIVGDEVSVV